jgi:hypothetical protein
MEEHQRRIYKRIVFNSNELDPFKYPWKVYLAPVQLAGHAYAIRLQGAV